MNMSDFLQNMCKGTGYAKINESANTQIDEGAGDYITYIRQLGKQLHDLKTSSELVGGAGNWSFIPDEGDVLNIEYRSEKFAVTLVDANTNRKKSQKVFGMDKIDKVMDYVKTMCHSLYESKEDDIEECGANCNEEDSEATITVKGNKVIVTVDGEDIELTKEEAEGLGIDLEECGEAVQVENVARGATIATLDDDDEYKSVKTFVNESRGVTYKFLDSLDEGVTGEAELPETVNVGAMYSYKKDFYIVTGEVNGNVIMVNADGDEIQVPIQDFEQDASICESEEDDEEDYGDDIDEGVQPKGNSWEDVINMLDSKYGIPAIERSNGGLFVNGCHQVEAICKGNVRGWTLKINGKNHTCRPSTNAICKCIANAINESAVNEGAFDKDAKALISKLAKKSCKAKLVKSNFDGYKLSAYTKDGVAIEIEYDDNSGTYSVYDDASGDTMDAYDEKELFSLI